MVNNKLITFHMSFYTSVRKRQFNGELGKWHEETILFLNASNQQRKINPNKHTVSFLTSLKTKEVKV